MRPPTSSSLASTAGPAAVIPTQDLHRAPQQECIAQGLCRGGEDEQLRLGGKRRQARGVALLDLGGNRLTRRKAEPAGNVREFQVRGNSSRASGLP